MSTADAPKNEAAKALRDQFINQARQQASQSIGAPVSKQTAPETQTTPKSEAPSNQPTAAAKKSLSEQHAMLRSLAAGSSEKAPENKPLQSTTTSADAQTLGKITPVKKEVSKTTVREKVEEAKALSNKSSKKETTGAKKQKERSPFGQLVEEFHEPTIAKNAIRLLGLALIAFIAWAHFTPIHELATGAGKVLPGKSITEIQHLEGGLVRDVLFAKGDFVEAGQPIIELNKTSTAAELAKAKSRAESLRLSIERQISFADKKVAIFKTAPELKGIADSQQSASTEDAIFRDKQVEVLIAENTRKNIELAGLRHSLAAAEQERNLLKARLSEYSSALKTGTISRLEHDNAAREVIQVDSKVQNILTEKSTLEASIFETAARTEELKARFHFEARNKVADLEVERSEALEAVAQLSDRLKRTTIRAPKSGILHNMQVNNSGEVIGPGELIAEIVPKAGTPIAEIEVEADQIGFITVGTPANVKVLTYDFARFGGVTAEVTFVSPSSFVREDTSRYYNVRVALDDDHIGSPDDKRLISPGMSIVADIRLGESNVLRYLLKPLRALSDRALTEK